MVVRPKADLPTAVYLPTVVRPKADLPTVVYLPTVVRPKADLPTVVYLPMVVRLKADLPTEVYLPMAVRLKADLLTEVYLRTAVRSKADLPTVVYLPMVLLPEVSDPMVFARMASCRRVFVRRVSFLTTVAPLVCRRWAAVLFVLALTASDQQVYLGTVRHPSACLDAAARLACDSDRRAGLLHG
jgi:hypothetical protein